VKSTDHYAPPQAIFYCEVLSQSQIFEREFFRKGCFQNAPQKKIYILARVFAGRNFDSNCFLLIYKERMNTQTYPLNLLNFPQSSKCKTISIFLKNQEALPTLSLHCKHALPTTPCFGGEAGIYTGIGSETREYRCNTGVIYRLWQLNQLVTGGGCYKHVPLQCGIDGSNQSAPKSANTFKKLFIDILGVSFYRCPQHVR